MLYLICAHLLTSARMSMSFNSVLICISQPCLRPYCVRMVCLRAHPYVRCAKTIWNGAVKAISAARAANINMTSHISAHHLGLNLAEKMRKESGVLPQSASRWPFLIFSLHVCQTWMCQIITPFLRSNRQLTMSLLHGCGGILAPFSQKWFHSVTLEGFLSTNWPLRSNPQQHSWLQSASFLCWVLNRLQLRKKRSTRFFRCCSGFYCDLLDESSLVLWNNCCWSSAPGKVHPCPH